MSISRDASAGIHVTGYDPTRILVALGLEGDLSTCEVEDLLGSSHTTAWRKLRFLNDLDVVTSKRVGRDYEWSLVDDSLSSVEVSSSVTVENIEALISDTICEVAAQLEETIDELPRQISDWVADRGVSQESIQVKYAYRLAVFHRLLRAALFELHAPEHNSITRLHPTDCWGDWFEIAKHETGDAGFASTPLDSLLEDADEEIDTILLALRRPMTSLDDPSDVLASVYGTLVPPETRRDLGQFATPGFVGQFMASWAIRTPDDTVLDPGIGAGQLSAKALSRKLSEGASLPLGDLTGIDVDPIAISMAAVALKLLDGEGRSHLSVADFIDTSPRSYTEDSVDIDQYDAVITNPPYSRHQSLDTRMKNGLTDIISRETGFEFSQRTPLYGYFLAHAAQFINPGGRLAAIVPSKFLDTEFGRHIKHYLQESFTIHGIVQFDDKVEVFEEVKTRPVILLLEKGAADTDHETRFIRLTGWSGEFDAERFLDGSLVDHPDIAKSTAIGQKLLRPNERWSFYLDGTDTKSFPGLAEFEDIAEINRGIATGHNEYFCLTQSEVDEYGISPKYRRPIIRSARGLTEVSISENMWEGWRDDGKSVWLLYCYEEGDDGGPLERSEIDCSGVLSYLDEASNETRDRYLVSGRDPWYRVESQSPADILGKYMNRTGFLFMRNDAELLTLNNIHTINLKFDANEHHVDALLAYLNSDTVSRVLSRESHDYNGLQKLEIGQLNRAPVLDPREISHSKRMRLAELFGELTECRENGGDDSDILEAIDSELEPLLGLSPDPES